MIELIEVITVLSNILKVGGELQKLFVFSAIDVAVVERLNSQT
jgi:hypothetical protein